MSRLQFCTLFWAAFDGFWELSLIIIGGLIAWIALWGYVAYIMEQCK